MQPGVSYNVGGVKYFSSILLHALVEERHFALVEKVPCPTKARSQSVFRSGTRSDPCISSVTTLIMITTSNSSAKEERAAQSITRCSTAHHRLVRACPRGGRLHCRANGSADSHIAPKSPRSGLRELRSLLEAARRGYESPKLNWHNQGNESRLFVNPDEAPGQRRFRMRAYPAVSVGFSNLCTNALIFTGGVFTETVESLIM